MPPRCSAFNGAAMRGVTAQPGVARCGRRGHADGGRGRGASEKMAGRASPIFGTDARTNRQTNARTTVAYGARLRFTCTISLTKPAAAEKPPGAAPTSYLAGSAISGGFKNGAKWRAFRCQIWGLKPVNPFKLPAHIAISALEGPIGRPYTPDDHSLTPDPSCARTRARYRVNHAQTSPPHPCPKSCLKGL